MSHLAVTIRPRAAEERPQVSKILKKKIIIGMAHCLLTKSRGLAIITPGKTKKVSTKMRTMFLPWPMNTGQAWLQISLKDYADSRAEYLAS